MSTKMINRIAEQTGRRRFLSRAGTFSLAATAGLLGVNVSPAEASCNMHGCCFYNCPGSPPCNGQVHCAWCWWGRCHSDGGQTHQQLCCEGYAANSQACTNDTGGGNYVCSYASLQEWSCAHSCDFCC